MRTGAVDPAAGEVLFAATVGAIVAGEEQLPVAFYLISRQLTTEKQS